MKSTEHEPHGKYHQRSVRHSPQRRHGAGSLLVTVGTLALATLPPASKPAVIGGGPSVIAQAPTTMSGRPDPASFDRRALKTEPPSSAQTDASLEGALGRFWKAPDRASADRAAREILGLQPPFDDVYARLAAGPTYSPDVSTGRMLKERTSAGGMVYPYLLQVPESYAPGRRYEVRVYLHGGVARPRRDSDGGWWRDPERLAHPDQIAVFPYSWQGALWWDGAQVQNLAAILRAVERDYNIDENNIHLVGVSDGGTGAWFQAFRAPTPWASFVVFIAHPAVLNSPRAGVDGEMFVPNLRNRSFFVVNGGIDRLYPAASVLPYLELFESAGVEVVFLGKPTSGHDTRWWPDEADRIDAFIRSHPRDPLPDRLWWETERTDRYRRIHWLMVDELGPTASDAAMDRYDTVEVTPPPTLGVRLAEAAGDGVLLARVEPGSPAHRAGLRDGDLVLRVEDSAISTVAAAQLALGEFGYGDRIRLTYARDGERHTVVARIPDRPQPQLLEAFRHSGASGRIELARSGNTVEVRTRGVRRYTLLLSPEQFDLSQPIRVVTNGRSSFEGMVEPDVATLLRWAAGDHDRTMLFAAELTIRP